MTITNINGILHGPPLQEMGTDGLGCLIYETCEKFSDKICNISPSCSDNSIEETETFGSFKDRSARVATELIRQGLKSQDVIVNCCPNNSDSALTTAACWLIGAIPSSLDPALSDRDCGHLIKSVNPKFIFVHEDCLSLIEDALKISGFDQNCTKPQVVVHGARHQSHLHFNDFLKNSGANFRPRAVKCLDETALIVFSSGSTGLAKPICLTHRLLISGSIRYLSLLDEPRCLLHCTTLYWISAVFTFISSFISANSRVAGRGLRPEEICKLVERYKVTTAFMGSSIAYEFDVLHALKHKYDLAPLKTIIFSGGPISSAQMLKMHSWFPEISISVGYGMSEIGSMVTGFSVGNCKLVEKYPNSCGRPLCGTQMKVVDLENGTLLGPNQTGEIRFKGCGQMNGYYQQTQADLFDDDGFFKSGDLGYYNEDYCFYISDRIREMFKYKTTHIVPAAIEEIIREHPDVFDVMVFGIPDEESEYLPAAAVVPQKNVVIEATEIEAFVQKHVVDAQKLRGGVFFVENIPKTPTGKMKRRFFREILLKMINAK